MDNLDYDLYKYGGGSQQVSVPKPSLRRNSSDGKPAGTQVSPSPAQSKPESPEKEKAPSSNTGKGVAEQEKPVYRDSQKVRHTTSSSDKKRKKQPQSDTIQIRNFPLDVYAIVAKEFPKASSRTAALTAYCIVHSDAIVDMSALSDDVRTLVEEYNGSTIAGSAQTLKAALDSLNSNSIKRTDNIFVRANTEDTVDLPFSNGDSNAVFLLSIGNTYGAGGVWCILPKSSSESMKITPLIPSEYFVLEGIGYDKIKVTALSASGNVQIINLNS